MDGNSARFGKTYDQSAERDTDPDPDGEGGPQASPVTIFGYDHAGLLTSVTSPMGYITSYGYDERYRLVQIVQPDPDGGGPLTSPIWAFGYDNSGLQLTSEDPEGRVTTSTYDALGRLESVTGPNPGGEDFPSFVQFAYDRVGNLRFVREMLSDTLERVTERVYDNRNRMTQLIEPDPDGDPEEGLAAPVTHFAFDAAGQLLSLTDASGNTTEWQYDNLGRVKVETNELGLDRLFQYDLVGNMTQRADRNGRVTLWGYDDLYRPTTEVWMAGETVVNTLGWEYDQAGRLIATADDGDFFQALAYDDLDRLTSTVTVVAGAEDVWVAMLSAYNADSRRVSVAAARMIVEDEEVVDSIADFKNTYSLDHLGRVKWVTQQSQPVEGAADVAPKRVDFQYNAAGQVTRIDRYEATTDDAEAFVAYTALAYDPAGRLASIEHAGDDLFVLYQYAFDRANRLTAIDRFGFGPLDASDSAQFGYDLRDQLISASHTYAAHSVDESYAYDSTGNRTESHLHGDDYSTAADNRLESDGTYWYLFDNEGNTTEKRLGSDTGTLVARYTWDHRNRLTLVEIFDESTGDPVRTVGYAYDTFDRRVSRYLDEGSNTSIDDRDFYYYDGGDVALVLDENLAPEHRRLFGPAVDMILADETRDPTTGDLEDVYWALSDHQGTVRDVATFEYDTILEIGVTTHFEHVETDTYGRIVEVTHDIGGVAVVDTSNATTLAYVFTGREWDPDVQLAYHFHRWYDPGVGRWLSQDPVGFAGGDPNLYGYVFNSPLGFVDPSGLDANDLVDNPYVACTRCHYIVMNGHEFMRRSELERHLRFREISLKILEAESLLLTAGATVELAGAMEVGSVAVNVPAGIQVLENGTLAVTTTSVLVPALTTEVCADTAATLIYLNSVAMAAGASGPEHHIATNKNSVSPLRGGPWTPKFERLFAKAGMKLEDVANRIRIPGHKGPHPEAYHSEIYNRLSRATDGLCGQGFKDALLKELELIKEEASSVGSTLHKLLTGG